MDKISLYSPGRQPAMPTILEDDGTDDAFDRAVSKALERQGQQSDGRSGAGHGSLLSKQILRPAPVPPSQRFPSQTPSLICKRLLEEAARGCDKTFTDFKSTQTTPPPTLPNDHWASHLWNSEFSCLQTSASLSAQAALAPHVQGILDLQRRAAASIYEHLVLLIGAPKPENDASVKARLSKTFSDHYWMIFSPLKKIYSDLVPNLSWGLAGCVLRIVDDLPVEEVSRLNDYVKLSQQMADRVKVLKTDGNFFKDMHPTTLLAMMVEASRDGLHRIAPERFASATRLFLKCGPSIMFHAPEQVTTFPKCLNQALEQDDVGKFESLFSTFFDIPFSKKAISFYENNISASDWIASGLAIMGEIDSDTVSMSYLAMRRIQECLYGRRIKKTDGCIMLASILSMTHLNRNQFAVTALGMRDRGAVNDSIKASPIQRRLRNERILLWIEHMFFFAPKRENGLYYMRLLRVMSRLHEPHDEPDAWLKLSTPLVDLFDDLRQKKSQQDRRGFADEAIGLLEEIGSVSIEARYDKARDMAKDVRSNGVG